MKIAFSIFCLAILTLQGFGQVKSVDKFLKEHPDLKEYFIYQSTLRMANRDADEDFNNLIKDIRKIIVHVSEGESDVTIENYDEVLKDLFAEDFETLINAKYEQTHVDLVSRGTGSKEVYVLLVHDDTDFALMEMDGSLDLRYLGALTNMDFEKLTNAVMQ